jgi:hypothetical protein
MVSIIGITIRNKNDGTLFGTKIKLILIQAFMNMPHYQDGTSQNQNVSGTYEKNSKDLKWKVNLK